MLSAMEKIAAVGLAAKRRGTSYGALQCAPREELERIYAEYERVLTARRAADAERRRRAKKAGIIFE